MCELHFFQGGEKVGAGGRGAGGHCYITLQTPKFMKNDMKREIC